VRRIALLAFIWGWSFVFIKIAVRGLTPVTVAFGRVSTGLVALAVIAGLSRTRLPRERSFWRNVAVSGLFGAAIPFSLLAWAEQRIASSLTSVAQATTTIFAALASALVMRERLRGGQLVGLAVGLAGVAVASGLAGHDVVSSSVAGVAAAVLAGLCYGINYVHIQRNLTGVAPLAAATGQLAVATALLAVPAVVTSTTTLFDPTPGRIAAVLELGVVATGVAYWINYGAIAAVGATRAALVTYLVPPVAIVVGWLALGEAVDARLLVGTAMIIGGVAAVGRHRARRPSTSAALTARR